MYFKIALGYDVDDQWDLTIKVRFRNPRNTPTGIISQIAIVEDEQYIH